MIMLLFGATCSSCLLVHWHSRGYLINLDDEFRRIGRLKVFLGLRNLLFVLFANFLRDLFLEFLLSFSFSLSLLRNVVF